MKQMCVSHIHEITEVRDVSCVLVLIEGLLLFEFQLGSLLK